MSVDIATLGIEIDTKDVNNAIRTLSNLGKQSEDTEGKVSKSAARQEKAFMGVAKAIKGLIVAYGGLKVAQQIKDSALLAARYETLGVSISRVGINVGYTHAEMNKFTTDLEKTGISMVKSREALVKMVQANMDLTKASQLARVAQDAAVAGNTNSSDAFIRLVYGIQSAQVEVLRTIGINVNFERSYAKVAKELGRTANSFTEAEKSAIRMNVVLDAGKTLSGLYVDAMETAGKQLNSLDRYFENLSAIMGAAFTPALAEIVQQITGDVKGLNKALTEDSLDGIKDWGTKFRMILIDIEVEISRVAMLIDKIGGTLTQGKLALYGPGMMMGNENSTKQFDKALEQNKELEKRYTETEANIEALALKYEELAYSLTEEGKAAEAAAKAKKEAAEDAIALKNKEIIEQNKAAEAAQQAYDSQKKEREKLLKSFMKMDSEEADFAINENQRALNKIVSQENKKVALIEKAFDKELISRTEMINAIQKVNENADLAGIKVNVDQADELASYYQYLAGFEDQYYQNKLNWIDLTRQMLQEYYDDDVSAAAWAAKEKADLEQELFEKRTEYLAESFGELQSAFSDIADIYDDGSKSAKLWEDASRAMEAAQKGVALVNAVNAVLTQGQGEPYSAPARMAAMVAMVSALLSFIGVAFGGGGGSGGGASAKKPASTALGTTDQSESVSKSFGLLQDTYDMQYDRLTGIFNEMQSLNTNITWLVNISLRASDISGNKNLGVQGGGNIFTSGKGYSGYAGSEIINMSSNLPIGQYSMAGPLGAIVRVVGLVAKVGDLLNKVTGGAIASSKTRVTGAGIYSSGGLTPYEIMMGGQLGVDEYADLYKKTTVLGHTRRRRWTEYGQADQETTQAISSIFHDLSKTFFESAKIFGMDAQSTLDYVFPELKINLKGLEDADEINSAVNEAISTLADNAAASMFEFAKKYQEAGEGMYETVIRIAQDLSITKDLLGMIGNESFFGLDTEQMISVSENMINLAGGINELASSVSKYYDKFYTAAEQQKQLEKDLNEQFLLMNMSLPATRDGFRSIVESLDVTTESGQRAFVTLMKMSDAADDYYSYIEDSMKEASDLASSLTDQLNQRTMSDADYQSMQIENTYQENIAAINRLASETGLNFEYLIDIAAKIRDIDKDSLKTQQESVQLTREVIRHGNTQGVMQDLFALVHDTNEQQSMFRDIEMWYFDIITQLGSLGIGMFAEYPSPEAQAFWELIDAAFIQKVEDFKDKILETQQGLIDAWGDAIQEVRDQIYDLMISSSNPMDETARLALQRQAIDDMLGGMSVSDYLASLSDDQARIEAVQKLQDMYGDILGSAQDMYQRPSSEYQAIYDEIMGNLTELADLAGGYQTQAQIMYDQLDALQTIEEILAYIAYDKSLAPFWWEYLPDIQTDKTESATSPIDNLVTTNQTSVQPITNETYSPTSNIVIQVYETESPEKTALTIRKELEGMLNTNYARKRIQSIAVGR